MKKVIAIVLAVLMICSFAACTSGGGDTPTKAPSPTDAGSDKPGGDQPGAEVKKYKIGVSIMELTAYTWFQGVIDGCNKWAKDNAAANNVELTFSFEDSKSDVQTMLNNVENMVSGGSNGIILFPADASSAIPLMKQYTADGIPFIIGDYPQEAASDADKVWSTFVGHDMKALGKKAGELAVSYLDTLNKEDPVCLFISRPTSGQVSADRYEGFKAAVTAKYPKARVIEEGDTGAGNRDSAQTLMENVLQREGTIDVVCGHNDAEVVGAYYAAQAQGRTEIKFIGIAGDKDVLGWITEGNASWLGEVLQDPVVLGYQATDAIVKVLTKGEKLPENYDLPEPEAITKENASSYDWKSWGWLG